MKYDELLTQVGSYGRFQKKIVAFSFLIGIVCGFNMVNTVFTQYSPDHHCAVQQHNNSHTDELGNTAQRSCTQYNSTSSNKTEIIPCQNGWTYTGEFTSAINEASAGILPYSLNYSVTHQQFNMVCSRAWMKATIQSSFFAFRIFGLAVDGILSDKIGRRRVLLAFLFLQCAFPLALSFATNIWVYAFFFSLYGSIASTTYYSMFNLGCELTGPKWRNLINLSLNSGYIFGYALLPLIAYLTRHWRAYLRVISALCIPLFVLSIRVLPESSRWLMSKNNNKAVLECIKKIAKENNYKGNIGDLEISKLTKDEDEKQGRESLKFIDTLRNGKFVRKIFVLPFAWIVLNISYHGLALNSGAFGGNIFLNCFYSAIIELPCILFASKLMAILGRPLAVSSTIIIGGIFCIASPLIKTWSVSVSASLAIIGKGAITGTYFVMVAYTCELLPTIVRTRLYNICGVFGKFGAFVSPYIMLLGDVSTPVIPFFTIGIGAVVIGALTLMFMPETTDVNLPETLEDVIRMQPIRKKICRRNTSTQDECRDGII